MVLFLIMVVVLVVAGMFFQAKFKSIKDSTVVKAETLVKDVVTKVEEKVEGK